MFHTHNSWTLQRNSSTANLLCTDSLAEFKSWRTRNSNRISSDSSRTFISYSRSYIFFVVEGQFRIMQVCLGNFEKKTHEGWKYIRQFPWWRCFFSQRNICNTRCYEYMGSKRAWSLIVGNTSDVTSLHLSVEKP